MNHLRALALALFSALVWGIATGAAIAADAPSIDLTNALGRDVQSLNGKWQIIVDPLDHGDTASQERSEPGYFNNHRPSSSLELIEYSFHESQQLSVPGDWNTQDPTLFFYDRSVWYQRGFTAKKKSGTRQIIHFGAANYRADVYLNGNPIGSHEGGFTPFGFDVTDVLVDGENSLVVKVNAQHSNDTVPTQYVDWLNYGGLTRDVALISVPSAYVTTYFIRLSDLETGEITATLETADAEGQKLTLAIPELDIEQIGTIGSDGRLSFTFLAQPILWSPETPKLYGVDITLAGETIRDRIGFRTIEAAGRQIVLNGKPIFLRGIGLHEETFLRPGRVRNKKDAKATLELAKELGANFVRLAHHTHSEHLVRQADELGLLIWSEIPVDGTMNWTRQGTLEIARQQLREMILRDGNRASVVLRSVGNATPQSDDRLAFLKQLIEDVRALDKSRLITSALIGNRDQIRESITRLILSRALGRDDLSAEQKQTINEWIDRQGSKATSPGSDSQATIVYADDPLSDQIDVIGFNQYFGWYDAADLARELPLEESTIRKIILEALPDIRIEATNVKPLIISAFGAGAKAGFAGDAQTLWSEAYQARVYQQQIAMISSSPHIQGMAPLALKDFRSARRPLAQIQDYWNRQGLVDETGTKKAAFNVLKTHYQSLQSPP